MASRDAARLLLAPTQAPRAGELERIARAVDARDGYTARHSRRVCALASDLGRQLRLGDEELSLLSAAALFHDVGKLRIPDEILLKRGSLTDAEWSVMRDHSEYGAVMVEQLGLDTRSVEAVRYHHERFDGSGYPSGLAGQEIPLAARIIHVADAFDSMTSDRVYRSARPMLDAIKELRIGSGEQFCPRCVRALEKHFEKAALRHVAPAAV